MLLKDVGVIFLDVLPLKKRLHSLDIVFLAQCLKVTIVLLVWNLTPRIF